MPEFHIQNPDRVWSYTPVKLHKYPAHDRVDSLRAKLDELKIDHSVFAEFRRTPQAIHWSSDFNDLKEYSELPNSQDILKKFNEYSYEVIRRCEEKQDLVFKEWFEKIFNSVSIFSNGNNFCVVWGLELQKKVVWDPIPPLDKGPSTEGEKEKEDDVDGEEETDNKGPIIIDPDGPDEPEPPVEVPKWWLILLILLGLLFLIGLFCTLLNCPSCDRIDRVEVWSPTMGEVVVNPLPDRLPEYPNVQPPFSDEDIIEMPDQGGRVLSGILNVAMMSDDYDFESFMLELDVLLPSSEYELVYWDRQTRRVQIKHESDSIEVLKNIVKSSLSDYNVLTWSERIFRISQSNIDDNFWGERSEKNWHLKQIGADRIENIVAADTSVRIAIIDDGFDLNHEDFTENYSDPYNLLSRSNVVNASSTRSHGTHVAGIATAKSGNSIGSLGLADKCTLLPIQISDDVNPENMSITSVIDGILYALNKDADVINLSLASNISGFENWTEQDISYYKNVNYDESQFWRELFSKLEDNNVIVVMAAGNETVPIELDPMHSSPYSVYVCASDPNNELLSFSNYPSQNNDSMTVVIAPGIIWSLIPNDNYEIMPGTSMSAPLVASVIALMKCEYPEISNEQIREDLLSCPRFGESNIPLVWMPFLFNQQNELDS